MKLRNSDRAALLSGKERYAVVGPIFAAMETELGEGACLMLADNEAFWEAIRAVQEEQHWKSWRFGVRAGRLRATTPVTELLQPKFVETLTMIGVIGSVFASILGRGMKKKEVTAPEPHEQIAGAVQS